MPADLGVDAIPWTELAALAPEMFATRVAGRLAAGPAFCTFDVDFVDPAFCPGTGTPEVGGPTSAQALNYLRGLRGLNFVGFDVVEVSPTYDSPGQVTALLAANVLFEMLSLVAR
jgi:agmatinase